MTVATDEIVQRVMSSRRLRRPVPSYREFAGTVKHYAGPPHIKGTPYRVGSEPSQAYLLEQFDSGRWKRFFVCAPPQFGGKTMVAIIITLLRTVIGARLPVGYGLPTLADLDKAWAEKLQPGIKGSGYGDHLPSSGPGARGGRGHTLQLTDPETGEAEGILVYLAGGGYGSTVATALIDEIDQFRSAQTGEPLWEAIEDIFNRANSFGSLALRIGTGTIEDDTRSIILPLVFEQGTGTVPHPRCPHCRRWIKFDDDNMLYDASDEQTAGESVRLGCQANGCILTEDDRQVALRDLRYPHKGQIVDEHGAILGPEPRTDSLGLWWPALCSPLADMRELAKEHFRAKQRLDISGGIDHGLMRKYYRYRRCQVYLKDKVDDVTPTQISRGYLASLSAASTYSLATNTHDEDGDSLHVTGRPDGVEFLVGILDVQDGTRDAPARIYLHLQGWATNRSEWDMAWGHVVTAPKGSHPNVAELHHGLDRCHAIFNRLAQEFGRPLLRRGVDVGDRQEDIVPWLRRHPDWSAVKGADTRHMADEKTKDIQDVVYRRRQDAGWWLHLIDVHHCRQKLQNAFLVPAEKAGARHLPKGLDTQNTLIKHYCSRALIPDGHGGTRWSKKQVDRKHHGDFFARKDLLDTGTYGVGLAELQITALIKSNDTTATSPPPRPSNDYGDAVW